MNGYNDECIVIRYTDGKKARLSTSVVSWEFNKPLNAVRFTDIDDNIVAILSLEPGILITKEKYLL